MFLEKAVRSLQSQTDKDFTVLVSDDCGPDGRQAEDFVRSLGDSRFRYIRLEKNLGLAGNWNRCLSEAKTELVTLLHADDMFADSYVEKMKEAANKYPEAAMIFCGADIIDGNDRFVFSFPDFVKKFIAPRTTEVLVVDGDAGLASLLKGCYIMCPTICYRSAKIEALRFSTKWKMVLDLDFYSRVLFQGGKIIGIKDKLYRYRRHDSNQTKLLTESLVRFQEESQIYSEISATAAERGWVSSVEVGRKKTIIKLNILYCFVADLLSFRFAACVAKFRFLQGIS